MSGANNDIELSGINKLNIVIKAGIQTIPYVGSSLSTLYFETKQEKRFKRLETFYQEVAEEIEVIKDKIAPIGEHDKEALAAILEELNEKIEHELVEEKRKFLKTYLKNTLIHPVKRNYEERHFFLDALGSMSLLACRILGSLYNSKKVVIVGNIKVEGAEQYAIIGAVAQLKSFGFLASFQPSLSASKDNRLREKIIISDFGCRFCDFCLKS